VLMIGGGGQGEIVFGIGHCERRHLVIGLWSGRA